MEPQVERQTLSNEIDYLHNYISELGRRMYSVSQYEVYQKLLDLENQLNAKYCEMKGE